MKLDVNIFDIAKLKTALNKLPNDGDYDSVMLKIEDVKETIREVIISIQNREE